MKKKKSIIILIASLTAAFMLAGCSGNTSEGGNSSVKTGGAAGNQLYKSGADSDAAAYSENSDGSGQSVQDEAAETDPSRKLIRTVFISAETEHYSELVDQVDTDVKKLGGYVESCNETLSGSDDTSGKYISMTLRIPKDKADQLIKTIGDSSNITSRSENTDDVTLQYTDIESQKKALKTEEKRLNEMMENAKEMSDIIAIEDKLTEVRGNIDSLESQIRVYDNQIEYTTVNLDITEVASYSPTGEGSVGERISSGFVKSLKSVGHGFVSFFVWFISNLPVIAVWVLIIFAIVKISRSCAKRHESKKKKQNAQYVYYPRNPGQMNNPVQMNMPGQNNIQSQNGSLAKNEDKKTAGDKISQNTNMTGTSEKDKK